MNDIWFVKTKKGLRHYEENRLKLTFQWSKIFFSKHKILPHVSLFKTEISTHSKQVLQILIFD